MQRSKLRILERGYLTPEFSDSYGNNSVISNELYGSNSLKEALLNHFEFKLEHLLKWEDRNSMWFSLEARVPFLDYRLVEKTLATKSDFIINDGMTKYILREAMKGTLPEKIRKRKDKVGFGTPEADWFLSEPLRKLFYEIINSNSFVKQNYIDTKKVQKII